MVLLAQKKLLRKISKVWRSRPLVILSNWGGILKEFGKLIVCITAHKAALAWGAPPPPLRLSNPNFIAQLCCCAVLAAAGTRSTQCSHCVLRAVRVLCCVS